MHHFVLASMVVLAAAGSAMAQNQACSAPPVVVLGAPVPDVVPFQGGRYSFYQPGIFSSSYYQPSYTSPRMYYPRYANPGPYYYTPAYAYTPGYYSYYYTPGYFRY
jgi:hypothetical protein